MKNKINVILVVASLILSGCAGELGRKDDLKEIVNKLDLRSFNNSTGPRREEGKITLKDYGFSSVRFTEHTAIARRSDNKWEIVISMLSSKGGEIEICFKDHGIKGPYGAPSYDYSAAYKLKRGKDGFFKSSEIKHRDCPRRP